MEIFEKSQTVDPEVSAYVRSLVSAIGGKSALDDGRYVLGDDALACLKDLRRWLKLYDTKLDRFDVKRILAEANLVQGDLLEILGSWRDADESNTLRRKIALGSLELLTELTWPLVLVSDRATVNHVRHLPNIELAQVKYKRAILHHDSGDILRKAISAAVPSLSIPKRDRSPRDEGIINLVLFLFRNIAIITPPTNLSANIDQHDVSRAQVIHAFQAQDVLGLVLTVCSGMGEDFGEQDIIVMELLFHLLKGIDPRSLYRTEKEANTGATTELKKALQAEKAMLASQARNAPTRHNRFGTMIWVKQADERVSTVTGQTVIASEQKTLEKMDSSKKWNRPHYRARQLDVPGNGRDFTPVQLDADATRSLEQFVSAFLDSSFNPLFIHVRRAIERDSERVKDDHRRQFFYLIHWFLSAEEARRKKEATKSVPSMTEEEARQSVTSFAYVAGVLNQETFVLLGRKMQQSLDEKVWHELHTCMLAFTQIMLTVSAMSESPSDDDQEIAENIQSRIFYEESTHDRILQILRVYQEGRQGFAFLDACTDLAHVFIRLLERYSKVNVDMYIRSKRRARKKAQGPPQSMVDKVENGDYQHIIDAADDAEDKIEANRQVQERKFDFGRFAARFVNDGSVNTFVTLTSHFLDLSDEQLKRCHRFFYRVAFKMERAMLLFRVDILRLFKTMIQGPEGLDMKIKRKSPQFKEWEELSKQVFRRCIKKLEERPEMYVELLFTKIPATLFYLEHGYEKEVIKSAPRPPAELEIKPGMDHVQQIGVAVGVLVDQGKLDVLIWVKTVLMEGIEERRSWEDRAEALRLLEPVDNTSKTTIFGGASDAETQNMDTGADDQAPLTTEESSNDAALPPPIIIKPDLEERRTATFRDKHLRLLLKTLAFQRLGLNDDPDANWIIPSELTAGRLQEDLDAIRNAEFESPSYENGKSAEFFTRPVMASRQNAYEKDASDEDGDSDLDAGLFVPGGPTRRPDDEHKDRPKKKRLLKRKEVEITDEQAQARALARKQREKEKDAKIKSALFVTESDDESDDEKHQEFFRLEQERRGDAAKNMKAALLKGKDIKMAVAAPKKNRKRKTGSDDAPSVMPGKKSKLAALFEDADSEDEEDMADYEDEPIVVSSRESTLVEDSESDSDVPDAEDTPLSSQTQQGDVDDRAQKLAPLTAVSGNAQRPVLESDGEDDVVVKAAGHRRSGRPIILDDDSD